MTIPEPPGYRRRMQRKSFAFSAVEALARDPDVSIGNRLAVLRGIRQAVEREEMRLHMQLGCDVAKDLAARGVRPSGRTVEEAYAELDLANGQEEP